MTSPSRPELLTQQMLRGLAAFAVVLYHAGLTSSGLTGGSYLLPGFFKQGYAGVDVFFCLSGFIIFHAHQGDLGRRQSLPLFLMKRFVRIYPIYWVVTLLVLATGLLVPRVVGGSPPAPGYVLQSLLLIPQGREPLVTVAWTLIHELRFYVLFCGALLLPPRVSARVAVGFFLLSLGTLCLDSLHPAFFQRVPGARLFLFLFHPSNLHFTLGVLASFILSRVRTAALLDGAVLGAGAVSMTAAVLLHDRLAPPGMKYHAALFYAVPSFLVVLGLALVERRWRPWIPRPLVQLGNASYSLYLIHWPVLVLLVPAVFQSLETTGERTLALWGLVAVAVGAGAVLYVGVERPLLTFLRGRLLQRVPTGARARPGIQPGPTH
ncbi:peptidoglycan/LPS O-acetylase OafA/YrhL [Archangium gephyra]|uniref:Exopolysaccharide production protein ExoZ n=1 Tax=Archangium gephyra TaxID=48 RepID=A0AAC8TC83_9BACT|nr:acyltransferase [Archangium gephyra]AKJ00492.1 Exopolysaccharide production protein ExoZ [Archangium gephyra]REG32814.1 peptidoglycan/LPS O-acetylase OafA/YrhL [Archangium gephyra]